VVQKAIRDGIRMLVLCWGDGTVDVVAKALVGTNVTLGIFPTGSPNNLALSLGIPIKISG
jgi:diacylglycerol kinase (ATP)